jgi:hypothetical protein
LVWFCFFFELLLTFKLSFDFQVAYLTHLTHTFSVSIPTKAPGLECEVLQYCGGRSIHRTE